MNPGKHISLILSLLSIVSVSLRAQSPTPKPEVEKPRPTSESAPQQTKPPDQPKSQSRVPISDVGGVRWAPALGPITAPDLPNEIRNRFFSVAAGILLRPSPPPDQDITSAGRSGKYMVIKRLLPLFEQYAPDFAAALKSQVMIGVTREFLAADNVRPWEVVEEEVKGANAIEEFVGEDRGINIPLITSRGLKIIELDTSSFSFSSLVGLLAEQDFTRANDLAKSFKFEAPRAVATLAVARVALKKPRK